MSYRIVITMVAAMVITGAAACTKSEAPKPAAAPAASASKEAAPAPAEKPAMGGDAAKPAAPAAPKPESDADDT